ncbi:hypothetical protein B0T10DRAFT_590604 [Thelonectria olida]|uniref:Uncharacterized protein n=1 Tax=Thelonectria olida TaxID=1576542 RepID=A0A9P8VRV1_9HYPO|nr:hypothetical protein B0T10DRAFT_590604 [Thelonectria olida]
MGKGPPRLDKYRRLIARFYEALILLSIVQKVQGPHIIASHYDATLTASRRRFIKNLAFICDSDKGGEQTSSIAIQECENCFRFWLASNGQGNHKAAQSSPEKADFLKAILRRLQSAPTLSESQRKNEEGLISKDCAIFARRRLKKESRILANTVEKYLDQCGNVSLGHEGHEDLTRVEIEGLKSWLQQFGSNAPDNGYQTCLVAYNARNDPQMQTLRKLSHEMIDSIPPPSVIVACRTIRHFVGRLADHIRVPKQLVEDAMRMGHILDVHEVTAVEQPICETAPGIDSHTTLDGLLTRMFKDGDKNLPDTQLCISRLNQQVGLEARIKEQYSKLTDKPPLVHSEVQMLEHFHRNKLVYAENDRFVGTSKLSCFCCRLYFRHHPSRPVEPDSHEEVYLSWGPIKLPRGSNDLGFIEQRDILNLVIHDVRKPTLQSLRNTVSPQFHHPNSITGLSQSQNNVPLNTADGENVRTHETQRSC